MSLKEKIKENLKEAVKKMQKEEISVLRLLLAAILNREKEKRYKISKQEPNLKEEELQTKSELSNEEVIEVLSSEIKKRKESISEFERGKRQDLAEKEKKELEILQKYLPEQLSEEEIEKLVKEAVKKMEAKEIKDMGRVMAELMPKVKGKADGSLVSKIVKESLIPESQSTHD